MRKFLNIVIISGLSIIMLLGCKNSLEELNIDPNNPIEVPMSTLFTSASTYFAYNTVGADMSWYSSLFSQHFAGAHNQMQNADQLLITSEDMNNFWQGGAYDGTLMDLTDLIRKAETEGNNSFLGTARMLRAFTYSIATDAFGRIPYSEALKGDEILKPHFDNQQDIYQQLFAEIDQAISEMESGIVDDIFSSNIDFIYGIPADGDYNVQMSLWIKAAYALKARLHIHLVKQDVSHAGLAIAAASEAFTSNDDDMRFRGWNEAASGENSWYQFRNDRNQLAVSVTLVNMLENLNDPRLLVYIEPLADNSIVGAPNGAAVQDQNGTLYSRASPNVISATSPSDLITFAEILFIQAEAYLLQSDQGNAKAAYEKGVVAALERSGIDQAGIDAYLAQEDVLPAGNLTIEHVMNQKYLAAFPYMAFESWTDYRRTGFPTQTVNPNGPTPRRWLYPSSTRNNNGVNVPTTNLNSGVWWDDGTED